jgi:HPt (histidine-containing phosphotransfer) domain-containing protein
MMRDLMALFVKENAANVQRLQTLLEAQNWPELKKAAHKIKSSFALVGMEEHRVLAEKVEKDGGQDISLTQKNTKEIIEAMREAMGVMESKLRSLF